MALEIDGWALLSRIAAHTAQFDACDATAELAATLLVRTQLVRGCASEADFVRLVETVSPEVMAEVVQELAGYEALRILRNLQLGARAGEAGPEAARRRLLELVRRGWEGAEAAAPAGQPPAVRTLRRHRAMGARRIRSAAVREG